MQNKFAQTEIKFAQNGLKFAKNDIKYVQSEIKFVQTQIKFALKEIKFAQDEIKFDKNGIKWFPEQQIKQFSKDPIKWADKIWTGLELHLLRNGVQICLTDVDGSIKDSDMKEYLNYHFPEQQGNFWKIFLGAALTVTGAVMLFIPGLQGGAVGILGGVILGAGLQSTIQTLIQDDISCEEFFIHLGLGAVTSFLTAAGSQVSNQILVQLTSKVQAAILGSLEGAASAVISQGLLGLIDKSEQISWENILIGALLGGLISSKKFTQMMNKQNLDQIMDQTIQQLFNENGQTLTKQQANELIISMGTRFPVKMSETVAQINEYVLSGQTSCGITAGILCRGLAGTEQGIIHSFVQSKNVGQQGVVNCFRALDKLGKFGAVSLIGPDHHFILSKIDIDKWRVFQSWQNKFTLAEWINATPRFLLKDNTVKDLLLAFHNTNKTQEQKILIQSILSGGNQFNIPQTENILINYVQEFQRRL